MHAKFLAEFPQHNISLSTFAKSGPAYIMLANFTNRNSCLCTKHQNVTLKLKMLKGKYKGKLVQTENPDAFIRRGTDTSIKETLDKIIDQRVTYEVWKKGEIEVKTKSVETRTIKKMKLIKEEQELEEITEFRGHVYRVKTQYKAQRTLKENTKNGHIAIHLDFAEDYRCRSQEEVQSAYWNTASVTLHPAIVYYRHEDSVKVKSSVF